MYNKPDRKVPEHESMYSRPAEISMYGECLTYKCSMHSGMYFEDCYRCVLDCIDLDYSYNSKSKFVAAYMAWDVKDLIHGK